MSEPVLGTTPLHMACSDSSNANLVGDPQALLEAGADPNAVDNDGNTPLFFAARRNSHIRVWKHCWPEELTRQREALVS